ncbi:UDP-N-acetylglucosamine 4,6-dehydratase (inverting) [Candidatus Pelagibacter sp.]|jgi:UDP-N-acetylglucosamine 4,6-dehydratase/5-epimerase|nr:UDP-N-acetylglucosamine 4,6-dehydratase (inverting) [Candidatus Pelagibacter sp.]
MKKRILITGGTGTFGKAFVKYAIKKNDIEKVFIYSRDEMKQWNMHKNLMNQSKKIRYIIGDVRDLSRLNSVIRDNKINYIVHAAATKIVLSAELNPEECIKTNILGAMNIIEAAKSNNVNKVIALSTDKASSPINLYGSTKLASDKLFISANNNNCGPTTFSVVRYGNVMGSRGSVIPFFLSLNKDKRFPITDTAMTRFMISIDNAIDLVFEVINTSVGGEIFVRKSPSIKITNLAKAINSKVKFDITGIRPGEKLHEQMIGIDESSYTYEFRNYFVIIPAILDKSKFSKLLKKSKKVNKNFVYSSDKNSEWLTESDFKKWLSNYLKNREILS